MEFNVLVLGSGAATPTQTRNCSSQLISVCGTRLLIDCGEGTQNRLRQYHQKFQAIKYVLLSHLHGDHFFGLPGLLSTMHLCGRTEPITVFAPKGCRESMELLFEVSGTKTNYALTICEVDVEVPTIIHQDRYFHIEAFPLYHSVPTFGYKIVEEPPLLNLRPLVRDKYNMSNDDCVKVKAGGDLAMPDGTVIPNATLTLPRRRPRSYAYCCDTGYSDTIAEAVQGVDLLCMESTFDSTFASIAEERQHCTAAQSASVASAAGAGRLLLTHFSARYREIDPVLEEAKAIFPNTLCAEDGEKYEL